MILGTGKCSSFGGPKDTGVGQWEPLSAVSTSDLSEYWFNRLFLPQAQWDHKAGLARNLNPNALYCAMRWSYGAFEGKYGEILCGFTREQIRRSLFKVSANGKSVYVQAADWGPNPDTDRLIDLSPGALAYLGMKTDYTVTVELVS